MATNFSSVDCQTSIQQIEQIFGSSTVQVLPVTENGQFSGVIHRSDFIDYAMNDERLGSTAKEMMTYNYIKLAINNSVADAKEYLQMGCFPIIPIVDDHNFLVGIISQEMVA